MTEIGLDASDSAAQCWC